MAVDTSSLNNAANLGIDVDADADEAPTDDELKTVAARIKAARQAVTDPIDMQKYDDAQAAAKQLYDDQSSRSEWLGVADRIGNSLARIGAAKAGMASGTDQSHIDTGPQYDMGGALDRASKDYGTELGRIKDNKAEALKQQQEDYGLGERALSDVTNEKKIKGANDREDKREKARLQAEKDGREFTAGRDDKRAANETAKQAALFGQQQVLQTNQLEQKDKFENDRETRKLRDADVKDLDGQVKATQSQYQARQQLFNNLLTDSDLGKKSKDKLQADYGKQAAAAGVDLADIQAQMAQEETTRPGWLGGKTAEEERTGKQAILQKSLADTKNLLDALKARKDARLRGNQAPQADDGATGQDDGKVTVQDKSGKKFKLPASQLQDALKQGYSKVD